MEVCSCPALVAVEKNGSLRVLHCPFCGGEHTHGPPYGSRVSHCMYYNGSYRLVPPNTETCAACQSVIPSNAEACPQASALAKVPEKRRRRVR